MPELPEVETIKLGLQKKIIGSTIKKLEVLYPKGVQFDPQKVIHKKVLNVWRKAKMLGVNLSGDLTLIFHLKMTGQLIWIGSRVQGKGDRIIGGHPTADMKGNMPNSATVAVFEFDNGAKLYFNDQRRFGWIKLAESSKLEVQKELQKLGPEPLEKGFTWEILKANLLKHKSMPIKVALMDQSTISGIGNIYASEGLFLAKIDPRRKIASLTDKEFKKLHQGIIQSLETAVKYGGSTRAHFVNVEGERGYFLDYANVYGKEGQKCTACLPAGRVCSGKVVKITQAGRGTYFCPECQK